MYTHAYIICIERERDRRLRRLLREPRRRRLGPHTRLTYI